MELKQRNGVLGLETAKQVMVSFLILSVTAVAVLLALTSLNDSVGDTIDLSNSPTQTVTNETGAFVNTTGYTFSGYNSTWRTMVLTTIWGSYNQSNGSQSALSNIPTGGYNLTIPVANATTSTVGVVTNATTFVYPNVSLSFTYFYIIDSGAVTSILSNVSDGLTTFFASTGTIFSILIVVVIILAISIIIWAVGRFGQQTEGTVNL